MKRRVADMEKRRLVKLKKSGNKSDKKQPKLGRGTIEHTSIKRQTAKKMKKGDKRTPKHRGGGHFHDMQSVSTMLLML